MAQSKDPKKAKKTTIASKENLGRNSKGRFVKGNQLSVGNTGGRPSEPLSFRQQMKLRAAQDPEIIQRAIDNLLSITNDPTHPKFIEAMDKAVKLFGNYDPQEQKVDVTTKGEAITNSAFDALSPDEIRKFLKDK